MEEGDLERWRELSGFEDCSSGDDGEAPAPPDSISRVDVQEGESYAYRLASGAAVVRVRHDTKRGLSFQIWPSSLSLAQYAEQREQQTPGFWQGKRVLELGCGCGLSGLVFAALGATVALTDLPETMALLEQNISLNAGSIEAAGGSARALTLVWGETQPGSLPQEWRQPDFVVAADVVYHKHLFSPLLDTLLGLAGGRTGVLLAHVRRWKDDRLFFAAARKRFCVDDITAEAGLEGAPDGQPNGQASHTKGALRLFRLQLRNGGD